MIRTRQSTRRREADTSGSSPILHLAHFLYSNDASGVLLLLLLLVEWMKVVYCLERVCGGSLYSSKGRFLPSSNMRTCQTVIRRIRSAFPPKFTWRHFQVGSVPGLGWLVWSSLWASFSHVTQDMIICDFCLRIRCVFVLFRTCAPEIINSRKQLWS